MDFIDTHQHLIYRDRLGYGWTAGIPALASGDFTIADYQALTAGHGVTNTIFMETGVDDADYQAEGRFIADLMRDSASGILGQIAACRLETDAGLSDWLDEGPSLGVVGYRRMLHIVDDDMSLHQTFRDNLRALGRRGLPFDMCFLGRQLPIARELAMACDEQILVLDHCGVPDIAGNAFEPWAKGITDLAALPHVMCKFSGITAYCAPGTATEATVTPWVDHVLQSFGTDRIVWGGDWPVVNLGAGLPGWIEISRSLLSRLPEAEAQAIASGNARRIYRV